MGGEDLVGLFPGLSCSSSWSSARLDRLVASMVSELDVESGDTLSVGSEAVGALGVVPSCGALATRAMGCGLGLTRSALSLSSLSRPLSASLLLVLVLVLVLELFGSLTSLASLSLLPDQSRLPSRLRTP